MPPLLDRGGSASGGPLPPLQLDVGGGGGGDGAGVVGDARVRLAGPALLQEHALLYLQIVSFIFLIHSFI